MRIWLIDNLPPATRPPPPTPTLVSSEPELGGGHQCGTEQGVHLLWEKTDPMQTPAYALDTY